MGLRKNVHIKDKTAYALKKKELAKERREFLKLSPWERREYIRKKKLEAGEDIGIKKFPKEKDRTPEQEREYQEYLEKKLTQDAYDIARDKKKRSEAALKGLKTKEENKKRKKEVAALLEKIEKIDVQIEKLTSMKAKAKTTQQKAKIQTALTKAKKQKRIWEKLAYAEALAFHESRTPRSKAMDESKDAKILDDTTKWMQYPGKYDYPNVDTASMRDIEQERAEREKNKKKKTSKSSPSTKNLISDYDPDIGDWNKKRPMMEKVLERIEDDYRKMRAYIEDENEKFEKIRTRNSKLAAEDLQRYRRDLFKQKENLCMDIQHLNGINEVKREYEKYEDIKRRMKKANIMANKIINEEGK